ncbi:hypothetical protein [Burkholderia glumae]|uniref:hypothetical protein n=1 Tax=Burkholderia glumae TaxID=337 RepID=UPI00265DA26C|nr:hypothetical protein [Burkholderia glumae]
MNSGLTYPQLTTHTLNEVLRHLVDAEQGGIGGAQVAEGRARGAFDLWCSLVQVLLAAKNRAASNYRYDEARLRHMLALPR